MSTATVSPSPLEAFAQETMALALLRLRRRLLRGRVNFLERHGAKVGACLRRALRLALLAGEIALCEAPVWEAIARQAPREPSDLFCRQAKALRQRMFQGRLSADHPSTLAEIACALRAARTALAGQDPLNGNLVISCLPAPEADELFESEQVSGLAESLRKADQDALAEALTLTLAPGELFFVGLCDYFLCRGLQAESDLGADLIFLQLERADDLWPDDLGVLARALEQFVDAIEALLKGEVQGNVTAAPGRNGDDEINHWIDQGWNCYLAADYEGAVGHFTAALRRDSENFALYAYRGDAFRLLCEYDRAVADYGAALALKPASAPVLVQRARAHLLKGDLPRALADASAAIAVDPQYADAYTCRGEANADRGAWEEAIADFTAAIQRRPDLPWAHLGRAKAQLRKDAYDAAIADFDRVLALNPHYVLAQLQRGDAHRLKGDLTQAIVDYTEVLRQHPRNALALRQRGLARALKGDIDSALADYTRALQLDPEDAEAYCGRGILWRRKGDLNQASSDLENALRRAPAHAQALYHRGLVLLARGCLADSLRDFNDALTCNPHLTAAYLGQALVHERLGQFAEGIRSCGHAFQQNGKSAPAFLLRGILASRATHYAQAVVDLSQALRLDPHFPLAYQERGMAYLLLGDRERAIADCTTVLELQPANALAYAIRGIGYQLAGDRQLALADFSQALRFDPRIMIAGWHQDLLERAHARTTQLLSDYVEGLTPKPQPKAKPRAAPRPPADQSAIRVSAPGSGPVTLPDRAPSAPPTEPETPALSLSTRQFFQLPPAKSVTPEQVEHAAEPEKTRPIEQATVETSQAVEAPPCDKEVEDTAADLLLSVDADQTTSMAAGSKALPSTTVAAGGDTAPLPAAKPTDAAASAAAIASNIAKLNRGIQARGKSRQTDKESFSRAKKLFFSAAAVVLVGILLYAFLPRSGVRTDQGVVSSTAISAEQMLKDFTENPASAAKKYTIGHVTVSGEVAEVVTDKRPRIRFKAMPESRACVEAIFSHLNDMKGIKTNSKVTVRGECDGWQKNVVEITLCKLVSTETASR